MHYLTKKEAAQTLRVAESTIMDYVRAGKLPAYRPAGLVLFAEEDIKAFIEGGRRGRFQ